MKGVVLLSHGTLCDGYLEAAKLFFPDGLEQVETCPLHADSNIDEYTSDLLEKIRRVNTGEGVLILADLAGGTPANIISKLMLVQNLNARVIVGFNFPIFLELLGQRLTDCYDVDHLVEIGKSGIYELKLELSNEEEEEID